MVDGQTKGQRQPFPDGRDVLSCFLEVVWGGMGLGLLWGCLTTAGPPHLRVSVVGFTDRVVPTDSWGAHNPQNLVE